MIKWNHEGDSLSITYPNGISVMLRHNVKTGFTDVNVYLHGENVDTKVFKILYGVEVELPHGFMSVDELLLTKMLNLVSNLTIMKEEKA